MSEIEISVGLYDQESTRNVNDTLNNLNKNGYDLMVTAVSVVIPHNSLKCNEEAAIILQSAQYRIISGNIQCDSTDETVRRSSEAELLKQLSFADHLGTPSMIPLRCKDTPNLARIITSRKIKSKQSH